MNDPLKLVTDHCAHPWPQRRGNGEPSQDVALSGATPYGRYAIVCDGVSQGKHSDLGAKLVAVMVEDSLGRAVPDSTPQWRSVMASQVHNDVMHRLHYGARTVLGISSDSLHCTTLFAFVRSDTGEGFVHVIGDGVVAVLGPKPNDLSAAVFNWGPANVPFTLAHMQNPTMFKSNHATTPHPLTLRQWVWVDDQPVEDSPKFYTVDQGMQGITMPLDMNVSSGVVLMSDGITQISNVTDVQAIWEMTRFKAINPTVLRRRFNFGLTTYSQHQQMLQDDLAGAAIMVQPPSPPPPPPPVQQRPPVQVVHTKNRKVDNKGKHQRKPECEPQLPLQTRQPSSAGSPALWPFNWLFPQAPRSSDKDDSKT